MTPGLVPGQVYVGLGVLGLALFAVVNGWLILLVIAGLVRGRRERRTERQVWADLLTDPEVQDGLDRLEAAVRGQRKREAS